jgi:hypothetical protein
VVAGTPNNPERQVMPDDSLDTLLRRRTNDGIGLASAVSGYLDEVRRMAAVAGVELDTARYDRSRTRIEIVPAAAPDILVRWTPDVGWSFSYSDDQGERRVYYRVGRETDAASIIPDADNVGAWLAVLVDGNRDGHTDQPEPLHPQDEALIERLRTFGAGSNRITG